MEHPTLAQKQEALLAELSAIRDGQQRFAHLVAIGRRQPPIAEPLKNAENRVEGCLSNLWVVADEADGRCRFRADSDSAIVKGIAGLLCEFYSGQTPEEILGHDPSFLTTVGITQHLSPNRRNGLGRVLERIRAFAAAHRGSPTP